LAAGAGGIDSFWINIVAIISHKNGYKTDFFTNNIVAMSLIQNSVEK